MTGKKGSIEDEISWFAVEDEELREKRPAITQLSTTERTTFESVSIHILTRRSLYWLSDNTFDRADHGKPAPWIIGNHRSRYTATPPPFLIALIDAGNMSPKINKPSVILATNAFTFRLARGCELHCFQQVSPLCACIVQISFASLCLCCATMLRNFLPGLCTP